MRFPRLTPAARFNSRFALSVNVYKISFERQVRVQIKLSYCHVIAHHHFESVRWVTWLFTLLSPFSFSRTRTYSPLQYDRSLLISLNYEEIQKVNKHKKGKPFLLSFSHLRTWKTLPLPRNLQSKKHECSWTKFSSTRKKCHFSFPSKLKEKYLSGIIFKGLITYDGRYCTFQGDVKQGDSQQRLLAQHSVVTLLRHCFEWLQHCSNIAALCCPKNRPV